MADPVPKPTMPHPSNDPQHAARATRPATRPAPATARACLSALLALPMLLACAPGSWLPGQTEPPAPKPLWGSAWRLQALGDQPLIAGTAPTLSFTEPGRVAGNGSCNTFNGPVLVDPNNRVLFGRLSLTRMACAADVLGQENRYLSALSNAVRLEQRDGQLWIHADGQTKPLRFSPEKP